jgi:hypothetical protein
MVEFVKKHKVPLIILAVSVGLYLLYDYLTASSTSNANSSADDTDAADQAALQDELASLSSGSGGGSLSSPISSSPAVTGAIPSTATTPVSTGTVASSPTTSVSNPTGSSVVQNVGSGTDITPTNTGASTSIGLTQTATQDGLLIQEIQQGNPQAIAQMNAYDTQFQEADPQIYAQDLASGTNPYINYLGQAGGGGLTPGEQQINAGLGQANPFVYPTLNVNGATAGTSNPSESSGGESSTAGTSGSTSTAAPAGPSDIGTQLSNTLINPGSASPSTPYIGGGPVRQLTTIPSSVTSKKNYGGQPAPVTTGVNPGGVNQPITVTNPIITNPLAPAVGPVHPTGGIIHPG